MKTKDNNVSKWFPKHMFWDVNMDNLSLERDKSLIIPRALYFVDNENSFDDQVSILEKFYSKEEIIDILKNTTENISNRVCDYVSKRYHTKRFHRFSI